MVKHLGNTDIREEERKSGERVGWKQDYLSEVKRQQRQLKDEKLPSSHIM